MGERDRSLRPAPAPALRLRPDRALGGRALFALALAPLFACSTACSFLVGTPSASGARTEAAAAPTADVGAVGDYLDMMQRLVDGDAFTRADVFREVEEAAEYAPTTANRLRYALALSVPGHAGSDPRAAAARLSELIATGDALLPQERALADVQLHNVQQLLILEGNGAELEERLDAAINERDAETAETIRSLQSDNAELRTKLEDATSMLEAIMNIEESISEREDQ
jgi:hypothetical protein